MEKLIALSELDITDDKHAEVIEKLLPLTNPDNSETERRLGWVLLARVMSKCSAPAFHASKGKLTRKVAEMCRQTPSAPAALYVTQMLLRNPQAGDLHAKTIDIIINGLLDTSVIQGNEDLQSAGVRLFATRYGSRGIPKILKTLEICVQGALIPADKRDELVGGDILGISDHREAFVHLLFNLLSATVMHMKIGDSIPRVQLMSVLALALKNEVYHKPAIASLEVIVKYTRWAILPFIPKLVSLLVGLLGSPSTELFSCLTEISESFGASSTLHKHMYLIYTSLQHPLDEQEYGVAGASLLASMWRHSSFLVKPDVLCSVQRSICLHTLKSPSSSVYLTLLEAVLAQGHEMVPVPLAVARTVLARSTVSCQSLAVLCDALSRPRLHDLAEPEVALRTPAKRNGSKLEMGEDAEMHGIEETIEMDRPPTPVAGSSDDDSDEEPEPRVDEEPEEQNELISGGLEETNPNQMPLGKRRSRKGKNGKGPAVQQKEAEPKEQAPKGITTVTFLDRVQNKLKRKQEERENRIKKRKDNKRKEESDLRAGEASVDDMLAAFVGN